MPKTYVVNQPSFVRAAEGEEPKERQTAVLADSVEFSDSGVLTFSTRNEEGAYEETACFSPHAWLSWTCQPSPVDTQEPGTQQEDPPPGQQG